MKRFIIGTVVLLVLITAIGAYLYFFRKSVPLLVEPQINDQIPQQQKETRGECLSDNEIVEYKLEKKLGGNDWAKIIIKDKNINNIVFEFQIDNIISATHYHPIEIHKCGVYVIRQFNFDRKNLKALPGFIETIGRYDYNGNGNNLVILGKKIEEEKTAFYFSNDFRVDHNEYYLVLQRGYLGSPDYAIIIKDLKNLNDVFVLSIKEIEKQNPDMVGDIGFESTSGFGWTRDGRYFWARTSYGANTLGFIRIDTINWNTDFISAPKNILGGDVLNFENGYITVHPGNTWFGFADITQEEKEKRRKEGIGTELYIENLFTKERRFVASTTEPLWYFKPRWISDDELRYIEPNGEIKVYKIQ